MSTEIQIFSKHVPSSTFDQTISSHLGASWNVYRRKDMWVVVPPAVGGLGFKYFSDIRTIGIPKNEVLRSIKKSLVSVESNDDHRKFIELSGIRDYQHDYFSDYGMLAETYARKTMFYIRGLNELDSADEAYFESIRKKLNLRSALILRQTAFPYLALLSVYRFAYYLTEAKPIDVNFLQNRGFYGAIPNGYDYDSYIEPFLLFVPKFLGLSFNRPTSKTILIPEKAGLFPYEATAGIGGMFIRTSSSSIESKPFRLHKGKRLAKIQLRRYVGRLAALLNNFLEWSLSPSTATVNGTAGVANPGVTLQIQASVHGIFRAFSACAKNVDSVQRLNDFFRVLDQLAGLSYNLTVFKKALKKNGSAFEEGKCFAALFSEKFYEEAAIMVRRGIDDPDISTGFIQAGRDGLVSFRKSVEPLGRDIKGNIRTIRNLTHSAFLKDDAFLRTFEAGEAKISAGFLPLIYVYMLAFFSKPDVFLESMYDNRV